MATEQQGVAFPVTGPAPAARDVVWSYAHVLREHHRVEESARAAEAPCARCGDPINYDAEPWQPEAFALGHRTGWARGPFRDLDHLQPEHAGCRPTPDEDPEL